MATLSLSRGHLCRTETSYTTRINSFLFFYLLYFLLLSFFSPTRVRETHVRDPRGQYGELGQFEKISRDRSPGIFRLDFDGMKRIHSESSIGDPQV